MKKFKKLLALMLIIAMTMSILAGCGKKTQDVTKEGEETEVEKAESTGPKVFRSTSTSADTFNPHTNENSETSTLISYIYGNLLDLIYDEESQTSKFVPWHAESLPTTDDNIVWTFKIRDDVKWTDGTPINAHDYEYSYKMLLDPKLVNRNSFILFDNIPIVNANKYFKGEVEWDEVGIKAIDDKTLQITLETAMPDVDVYIQFTGGGSTSPIHKEMYEAGMSDDGTETTYGTTLDQIPSCGTYTLTEWVRDQYRVFEKNKDSIMADVYTPDRIESRVVTESSTNLQLFENGEIESVSVSGENYDKYAEDPRLVFQERASIWSFYINSTSEKNPILQNNDFRKALFYGIDRDKIAKGIYKTYASTPYFISTACLADIDNGIKYRDTKQAKSIVPEGTGYDPELAKEYFEKAYAANGNKKIEIEITYFDTSENFKRTAEIAEEEYENLFGKDKIDVKLRAMPGAAAYDAYRDGDYDLGIGARSQNVFNPWSSMKVWTTDFPNKDHRFASPEYDELYVRTTRGDLILKPEERLNALAEMEKMLVDYVPQIPLFQNNNAVLFQDRIQLITDGKYVPGVGFAELQAEIVD